MVGVPPYTPDELFDVVVEDDRVWVHLSPSFRRSLRLTPEQALALVAAGATLRSVPGADPSGPIARGLAKLAATLGVDPDDVFDVDLGQASATTLGTLRGASDAQRRVRLDYYSHGRDERTERDVDPYRVYADQGQWYVVGWDHLRNEERLFRIDRIVDVEVLDATFVSPEQPRTHALYEPGPDDERVVLDLDAEAAWVAEAYPVEEIVDGPGGRTRVTLAVSARPWLVRLLLRLGDHAVVVGPSSAELRAARSDAASRILDRYAGAVPSAGS
jgi:proteasome accessory factor C